MRSPRTPLVPLLAGLLCTLLATAGVAPTPAAAAERYVDEMFTATYERGVTYGRALRWPSNEPVDLQLDIARPAGDTATDRPAVIFVHGGGFTGGTRAGGDAWIRELAERGYVALTISYRLRPGYYFDFANQGDAVAQGAVIDAVNDAQAAVRWVRANAAALGVDPDRVAIMGSSAGGVTAAGVAMLSTQTGASGNPGQSSRVCVAAALAGAFSPLAADPLDDRTVFFHGTDDERVPYQYAVATRDALAAQGVPADLVTYEGEGHGLGLNRVLPDLVPYLRTHLVDGPCTDPGRAPGGGYHPVAPERIADTRSGLGSPATPLGPGQSRAFVVPDLPAEADAVAVNVTAVGATAATHLTVWPTGLAAPTASNLNLPANDTSARLVVTRLGAGDSISVQNRAGDTHVVVDLVGWFGAGGLGLTTDGPTRALDTRRGLGLPGPLVEAAPATLEAGTEGDVLVLNTTATEPSGATHVTLWPSPGDRPATSTLNVSPGETEANLAFAAVGADGVALENHRGTTHVVGDITGRFTTGGAAFTSGWPTRVVDTRYGLGGVATPLGAGESRTIRLDGLAGLPADGTAAVALSVTIVGPSEATHLTVRPSGAPASRTSSVNAPAGTTVPNLVVVGLGDDGSVRVTNESGAAHVLVDVLGWFA